MALSIDFRVRYAETDQMGVVHHSVYYIWFEQLRTEYFRNIGFPYGQLEEKGIFFPVVESRCEYREGARYDGEVRVTGWFREPKGIRVRLDYLVEQEGRVLVKGYTLHARTDAGGKPRRIPPEILKKIREEAAPVTEGPHLK